MLTEDLKPPKRARNPPHNWAEQKGKKEREGTRMGLELFERGCERRKEPTSWETT